MRRTARIRKVKALEASLHTPMIPITRAWAHILRTVTMLTDMRWMGLIRPPSVQARHILAVHLLEPFPLCRGLLRTATTSSDLRTVQRLGCRTYRR